MKSFLAANKNSPERLLRSSPYCPQNGDCQSLRLAGKCVFTGNSNRCFFLSKIRLFSGLHFWPKKTHNDNTQTKAIYKITAVAVEQNLPNNTMVRNTERQHNNGHKTRNLWWEHRIFDMEEFSSKSISTRKDYHSTNQGVFEARLQAGGGSVQRSSCHDPLKSERLEPRRGGRRGEVVRRHHLLVKVNLWCDDNALLIILILTKTVLAECCCIRLFSA